MLKMNKASDAYARNGSLKDLNQVECNVRSEHARRAIALFPNVNDCRAVLDSTSVDGADHTISDITFE